MLEDNTEVACVQLYLQGLQCGHKLVKRDLAQGALVKEAEGWAERLEPLLDPDPDEFYGATQTDVVLCVF